MIALLQRIEKADVRVNGTCVGAVNTGLCIFLGVEKGDRDKERQWLVNKCLDLRIFENEHGKFDYSLRDSGGEVLVVSQFTLCSNCRKGRRPGFSAAESPEKAQKIYRDVVRQIEREGITVATGSFGQHMKVSLVNDGPVTMIVDTKEANL
mgnify:CR=1 FL=1